MKQYFLPLVKTNSFKLPTENFAYIFSSSISNDAFIVSIFNQNNELVASCNMTLGMDLTFGLGVSSIIVKNSSNYNLTII